MRPNATWIERRIPDIERVVEAVRASDVGAHVAFPKLLRLVLADRYSPTEVKMLGLLGTRPIVPAATYLSKRRMLALQVRANPKECLRYCDNKLEFFTRCMQNGLATPRVFAALAVEPFDTRGIPMANSPDALIAILARGGPRNFVIKPVAGAHGKGIDRFKFDGIRLFSRAGAEISAQDIFAHMSHWGFRKGFLQDRVYPHRALVRLSGSESLQTSRVVTCLDDNDDVQIAIAWLRVIGGEEVFDNFNFGTSGNLISTIDLETGKLKHVMGAGEPEAGLSNYTHHPVTGESFDSFTVPFVPEIRDLTMRAGRAFKPLRTIGWDVAITDTGPMLIEGNPRWDPLPTRQDLRAVAAYLQPSPRV